MHQVIKVGARGGKIVGYIHGDMKRPIYWKPGMDAQGNVQDQAGGERHPATPSNRDPRLPAVGTELKARFKGQEHVVTVRENGIEYKGKIYRSISGAAAEIMQHAANGYAMFGLGKRPAPGEVKPPEKKPEQPPPPPPPPPPQPRPPAPAGRKRDARLPEAGTVMSAKHKGSTFECTEKDGLFHLTKDGQVVGAFRSLSGAGAAAVGHASNGYAFFGLLAKEKAVAQTAAPAAAAPAAEPKPAPPAAEVATGQAPSAQDVVPAKASDVGRDYIEQTGATYRGLLGKLSSKDGATEKWTDAEWGQMSNRTRVGKKWHALTPAERAFATSIAMYTSGPCSVIRSGDKIDAPPPDKKAYKIYDPTKSTVKWKASTEEDLARARRDMIALAAQPIEARVHRGIHVDAQTAWEILEEGKEIDTGIVSSWSTDPLVSKTFAGGDDIIYDDDALPSGEQKFVPIIFSMNAKRGANISALSDFEEEGEVISGGKVKVKKATKKREGTWNFWYVEVEQLEA